MRIECITSALVFESMRSEWNALLKSSAADTVFLTSEWLSAWWHAYGGQKCLLILAARSEDGRLAGVAPFYIDTSGGLRRLRFLGDGSFDSDYLDFIVPNGNEQSLIPAFLRELTSLRSQWDVLQLNEIPSCSPSLSILFDLQKSSGWQLQQIDVPCGIRDLPPTWDAFLQTLRPRFRTSVRGCLRDLQEWNGRFEVLSSESEIPDWLRSLFALHSDRWSLRGQSGVFGTDQKRVFYERMAREFQRLGWLYMSRYSIKDSVLACQFGFLYRDTYHLLQEGFDTQCIHVSPGITLRAATIRDLISRGIRTYDFLGGMGRHKSDWGAQVKLSVHLALAPPSFSALRYIQLPQTVQKAKDRIKQLLPEAARRKLGIGQGGAKLAPAAEFSSPNSSAPPKKSWKNRFASFSYRTGTLHIARTLSRHYEMSGNGSFRTSRLRKASGAKVAILCYHRVGSGGVPLYSNLPPQIFQQQMQYLRRHYRLVSLDSMVALLDDHASTGQFIAVTFDDGYRDVYTHAFPVLQSLQIPATIYLTVAAIEEDSVAWYDRIFLALSLVQANKFDVMLDKPRRFLLSNPASRLRAAEEIISYLRRIPGTMRMEFCRELDERVVVPSDQIAGRMLTWEQIRAMQGAGVCFGSHTLSHPAISRLSRASLDDELCISKQTIENRLQAPVKDFAYPFGKPADYGDTVSVISDFAYRTAVTTNWGLNSANTDRFRLRRVSICDEQHIPTFACKLTQLFLEPGAQDEPRIAMASQKAEICVSS